MVDFSKYKYYKLLEFLNIHYKHSSGKRNYAHYLLTMNEATSFKSLIKIYEAVYFKILHYLVTDKVAGHKNLDEDLNICFNENLVRLFLAETHLSEEECIKYLVNVRACDVACDYQKTIVEKSVLICGKSFTDRAKRVTKAKNDYDQSYAEFLYTYYEPSTNGYKELARKMNSSYKAIKEFGYVRLAGDYCPLVERLIRKVSLFLVAIILFVVVFAIAYLIFKPTDWVATTICGVASYFVLYVSSSIIDFITNRR